MLHSTSEREKACMLEQTIGSVAPVPLSTKTSPLLDKSEAENIAKEMMIPRTMTTKAPAQNW